MLFPVGHDEIHLVRKPWLTIATVATLLVAHGVVSTHDRGLRARYDAQGEGVADFWAMHPETSAPPGLVQYFELAPDAATTFASARATGHYLTNPFEGDSKKAEGRRLVDTGDDEAQHDPLLTQPHLHEIAAPLPALAARLWVLALGIVPAHFGVASLLTYVLVQPGWLALGFALWALAVAGLAMEAAWGARAVGALLATAALVAGVVHVVVAGESGVPAVGATGAIGALMGAFVARHPGAHVKLATWTGPRVSYVGVPSWSIGAAWLAFLAYLAVFAPPGRGGTSLVANLATTLAGGALVAALRASGREDAFVRLFGHEPAPPVVPERLELVSVARPPSRLRSSTSSPAPALPPSPQLLDSSAR